MDKATEQKLLRHAWQYGHFRNPAYPDTHDVKQDDYWMLSVDDDELARQAIESVQLSDCQCDDLSHIHHGRVLEVDGDAGPATIALLDIPRCQVPDFATDDDKFGLAGAGGWSDCDPEREHHHEVVIKFDDRNAPLKWVDYMVEVLANAVKISADIGLSVRYISPSVDEDYQSSVEFKNIPGSVIGFYYLPQSSGCRRIPQGALDTSYQPDVRMASLLWIHEGLGHGIGLPHTNGGVMNPSIRRTELSWRNDPSWRRIRQLYGGEPLEPTDPRPPPPDDDFKVIAEFVAAEAGQKFKVVTGKKDGDPWPF